ncbi:hypothetical protein GC105_05980 [Alkalibaculum sp. M08DMB]|uniref:Uncharacterized protein n=1 Tax=Alkalibaculum sporogenes TaxID=2655001 RepID=A0A6A7K7L1_9FIRM|nr:hypothetical protein [Alkalibaculum sporogenes]MPW25331.1 hypothetical protein [Alkalibaculum sporogenes]
MFDLWQQLTFGKYLKFLTDFVGRNASMLGLILFSYVIVIFVGRYGGLKYIRNRFDEFVITKSRDYLKDNNNIESSELVDKIYEDWKKEIDNFPSYVFIQSKRDYWIEKPNLEAIEQRLFIDKDKASEILVKNGVIIGE